MENRYDALLIVSFGGPEGMDEVMPFLENVLRGRNVPRERMIEVSHHYEMFGGVSPINGQNRALIAALKDKFAEKGFDLPIYWGNRNWTPLLPNTMRQMAQDGIKNALAFFTSAYSSYSGCRQYRENVARAQDTVKQETGLDAPQVSLLRKFYNHPGFVASNVENIRTALDQIPVERRATTPIAFTAHSIPESMARTSMYVAQLTDTCELIAAQLDHPQWQLVYQSRSGSPSQPWLGPDVTEHLRDLKAQGATDVVVAPVGFVSDHMEVRYDLDHEACEVASEIGLNMVRAATVGTHPAFIDMIYDLIVERITVRADKPYLGTRGPNLNTCGVDCCLPPQRG